MVLKPLQGWWLHHHPGQPVLMPHHSFWEVLPNTQPELPPAQLKAISSCPCIQSTRAPLALLLSCHHSFRKRSRGRGRGSSSKYQTSCKGCKIFCYTCSPSLTNYQIFFSFFFFFLPSWDSRKTYCFLKLWLPAWKRYWNTCMWGTRMLVKSSRPSFYWFPSCSDFGLFDLHPVMPWSICLMCLCQTRRIICVIKVNHVLCGMKWQCLVPL